MVYLVQALILYVCVCVCVCVCVLWKTYSWINICVVRVFLPTLHHGAPLDSFISTWLQHTWFNDNEYQIDQTLQASKASIASISTFSDKYPVGLDTEYLTVSFNAEVGD